MLRLARVVPLCALALALIPSTASAVVTQDGFESPASAGLGLFRAAGTGGGSNFAQVNTDKHSGSFSAFAPDPSSVSDRQLTYDATVTVPADAPAPQLSFFHRFQLEPGASGTAFDGGLVEVSVDGGAFSAPPDSQYRANPPNSTVSTCCSNPLAGQRVWSGDSGGFVNTVLDLSPYAGHTLKFRFRLGTDS